MTTLSSVLEKPVLNIATSCIIGKVSDVYFDKNLKKAVYFCISENDDKSDLSARQTKKTGDRFLPYADAENISDAIVIADDTKLLPAENVDLKHLRSKIIGIPVYTPMGTNKGSLANAVFGNVGNVVKLQTESYEFVPSGIMSIGEVIVQKSTAKNKLIKPAMPRPQKDYPVYILNHEEQAMAARKKVLNTIETMHAPINVANTKTTLSAPPIPQTYVDAPIHAPAISSAPLAVPEQPTAQIAQAVPAPMAMPAFAVSTAGAKSDDSAQIPETIMTTTAKPAIALGDSREPVLSNGAFEVLLDGSKAYSYDEDAHTPTRVICDYEFLLGRTLGADLCTYTGELIAKQGSAVSDQIVEKARRAGKLVELTLNSIKPEKQSKN